MMIGSPFHVYGARQLPHPAPGPSALPRSLPQRLVRQYRREEKRYPVCVCYVVCCVWCVVCDVCYTCLLMRTETDGYSPSSLCSFSLTLLLPRRYLDRRQYAAQCSFWDEILGNVTAALKVNGYKTYYIMVNMIWYMVY